ncbi:MAG: hypothetical protein AAB558_00625 [Patescibacteria group bacterium]
MGTITATVDDNTEEKFRETVKNRLGAGKGKLGQAITDAMDKWVREVEQEELRKRALAKLETGFRMGKTLYKHRDELYGR